jgi:hypothetical protein
MFPRFFEVNATGPTLKILGEHKGGTYCSAIFAITRKS